MWLDALQKAKPYLSTGSEFLENDFTEIELHPQTCEEVVISVSVKKLLNLLIIINICQIYYRISYTKYPGFEKTPLFLAYLH